MFGREWTIHFPSCFIAAFVIRIGRASLPHPQNWTSVDLLFITSNSPQSSQRNSTVTHTEQGGAANGGMASVSVVMLYPPAVAGLGRSPQNDTLPRKHRALADCLP